MISVMLFFFSSRRRHTRSYGDWSSDVCSSDLFMSLFAAVLGERVNVQLGLWLLPVLVAAGLASVFYWHATEGQGRGDLRLDRKSTRLNSSHRTTSYAVFCLKKKKSRPMQPIPI